MASGFIVTGLPTEHNLSLQDGVALITKAVRGNSKLYEQARIRYVLVKYSSGQWRTPASIIHLFPKGQEPKKTSEARYPDIQLRETWLSLDQLLEGFANSKLDFPDLPVVLASNKNWARTFFSGGNTFGRNPGFLYQINWQESLNYANIRRLLAYNQPYYPDYASAVEGWVELAGFTQWSAREGQLLMFVPECRAYIEKPMVKDTKLSVTVALQDPSISGLRFIGGWATASEAQSFNEEVVNAGGEWSAKVNLSENIEAFEGFLIAPDNTIFDYHIETMRSLEGVARIFSKEDPVGEDEAAIMDAIDSGEGTQIEFKPFVYPKHEKIDEVVRTIVIRSAARFILA